MLPGWLVAAVFFSILGLILLSQVFWFWRAHRFVWSRRAAWLRWTLAVPVYLWFSGLLGLFLLVPLRWFWLRDSMVLVTLYWTVRRSPALLAMGLWITASVVSFLLVALVRGAVWVVGRVRSRGKTAVATVAVERRHFLQTATYAVGTLPFVMVGYGFLIGRQNYRVEEIAIPIPDLPPALDGFRVLQLTDVHASAYMPVSEVRRIAGLAREVEADLVAHTGDYLTSRGDPLEGAVEELSRVEAPCGSFGCLGNHEIYARATDDATNLFARRGVRILRGKNISLEVNGARLNLIGVDYQRQPHSARRATGSRPQPADVEQWASYFLRGVEALVEPDAVNILLSHNPNVFPRAVELGIDLTLAGHTHGGQVQVEILDRRWSPALFMTPFISGLYQRRVPADRAAAVGDQQAAGIDLVPTSPATGRRAPDTSFLYVSRGLGTVGAPIRLNVPPEITLVTLRRA